MKEGYQRYFRMHKGVTAVTAVLLLILISYLDFVTGAEINFSIFYFIPVAITVWHFSLPLAILMDFASTFLWLMNDSVWVEKNYFWAPAFFWNPSIKFGIFLTLTLLFWRLRGLVEILQAQNQKLAQAHTDLNLATQDELEMKDQVLSNISHELRTPVNAVYQFTTILHDGIAGEVSEEQKQYLQIILRNISQLNRMVGDLLDSSRAKNGNLTIIREMASLQSVVDDVVQTLRFGASQKKVGIATEISHELPLLFFDPARIRQVLYNLLDNAIKFSPEGMRITIRAERSPDDSGTIQVSVSDQGPGVPLEQRKGLFQRMYQAENQNASSSRKGLGLGLYICREILKMHQGEIAYSDAPEGGGLFWFTLPIPDIADGETPASA